MVIDSDVCQFHLEDYELTPPAERAIVFGVSRIIDTYKETFGFSYPDGYKVTVTLFSNKDEFIKYQKKQLGSIISEEGFYSGKYREAVVLNEKNTKKTKDEKRMVAVVFHEANHLILTYHIPWVPGWVNEGLSGYFEGLNAFGENKRVNLQENRSYWPKQWAKKGFPIELEDYLAISYDNWANFRNRNSNAAYSIGYSLMYFMMSRSETEKVLKELLWEFKRQGKKANSVKVINEHYPGGLEKFKRQWLKWIPRARPYRPLRVLRKNTKETKDNTGTNSRDKTQNNN